jgi:hypothetical protein
MGTASDLDNNSPCEEDNKDRDDYEEPNVVQETSKM